MDEMLDGYGFISPDGIFHRVGWAEHTEWAYSYIDNNNLEDRFLGSMYDYPVDFLVNDMNWILLHSPGAGLPMAYIGDETKISNEQRKTLYDYFVMNGMEKEAKEMELR